MTNKILETILSNTFDKISLNHRLNLLKGFLEYQFFSPHENTNLIYLLNQYFTLKRESRDDFNALVSWDNEFFNSFDQKNLYRNFNKISQEVLDLPTVTVYLPFRPSIYEIPRLGGWFRKNVSPKAIMDVKSDKSLIGGCALIWKGIYRDFSLRFYIEKNKVKLTKVVSDSVESRVGQS